MLAGDSTRSRSAGISAPPSGLRARRSRRSTVSSTPPALRSVTAAALSRLTIPETAPRLRVIDKTRPASGTMKLHTFGVLGNYALRRDLNLEIEFAGQTGERSR